MSYRVQILPTAWEDLKQIEDWYYMQFSAETAMKVGDSILDAIERLEKFPLHGSLTPDSWLNDMGYRMVICDRHIAIYKIIDDNVYIYHIADTRTEYTKLFY